MESEISNLRFQKPLSPALSPAYRGEGASFLAYWLHLQLPVSPPTFLQFAQVNDAAAATTKKLQKHAILAEYFRGLDDDEDLRRAVRFAAGRPFAATDERVLNVGGALVSEVLL